MVSHFIKAQRKSSIQKNDVFNPILKSNEKKIRPSVWIRITETFKMRYKTKLNEKKYHRNILRRFKFL